MKINFSIPRWAAWAPGLSDTSAWQIWAAHRTPIHPDGSTIQTHTIPAMTKRRCSHLSKLALEVSNQALGEHTADYGVFCSQHGELHTTLKLFENLHDKTLLSPTHFSQSVHNTASGLFTIQHQMPAPVTSLAAGEQTFQMGMIEALTWLAEHPDKQVLLTIFDDVLPAVYAEILPPSPPPYAVAFCLQTNQANVSLQIDTEAPGSKTEPEQSAALPAALAFLGWWLGSDSSNFTQSCDEQSLCWTK